MAWIESHDDIWDHHKTIALCGKLKISDVQAVGHLTSLWHFTLRNAWRDANLENWGIVGIERAARWEGKSGRMVEALRSVGYLDNFIVHGWLERAGKLVMDRLYNEERRKNAVKRRTSEATLPNPTLPNLTLPTDNNRTTSPSAIDFSDYRLNVGKYKHAYVINVPVDECEFLLKSTDRLGEKEKAALKWRIGIKNGEMTEAQKKIKGVK